MGKGDGVCPRCGASQRGKPIKEEYLKEGHYGEWDGTPQYYSQTIMVEIPEVYDGGLYLMCPFCGGAWHRWTDPFMRKKAQRYIDAANAEADKTIAA